MSCIITNGYQLGCQTIGGIERVWVGTYSAAQAYSFDADNVVTAVTSGQTIYLMEQDIEFAGLVQTGNFSRENGSTFYSSVLSVKFIELDKELRNLIIALGRAPLFAVVKSNAGEYYILGVENAGRAIEGVAQLGVLQGDMNGANLSIEWKSANGAFLIDPTLVGTSLPIG
jgi:hypothetical protein